MKSSSLAFFFTPLVFRGVALATLVVAFDVLARGADSTAAFFRGGAGTGASSSSEDSTTCDFFRLSFEIGGDNSTGLGGGGFFCYTGS